MLHTLNKAWLNILAQQLKDKKINSICCCCCTEQDYDLTVEICHNFNIFGKCWIISEKDIQHKMKYDKILYNKPRPLPIFDDILISHEINDVTLKNYLSKHCRRKGA